MSHGGCCQVSNCVLGGQNNCVLGGINAKLIVSHMGVEEPFLLCPRGDVLLILLS